MTFRLSQKLCSKIKSDALRELLLNENPYADWSAHLFTANRVQYIILTNTATLYSCVMFGRGVADDSRFIERAHCTIREFVKDDGQQSVYRDCIAPESGTVSFAKALNRSVTGSMNDMIFHAKMWLIEENLSPHEVGFKLNRIPMSVLGYANPRVTFTALARSAESSTDLER